MKRFSGKAYMALVLFFLYAPILVLVIYSFNSGETRGNWEHFSLVWYQALLEDTEVLSAVRNTFLIAIVATFFSTVIGTLGAIGLDRMESRRRRRLLALNQVPVVNPDIVMAVGLMVLFRSLRLDFGLPTLLLAHIAFTVPYVVLSVLPKLRQMPPSLPEAAMDLGASPTQVLRKVVIPQIRPGIFAGALIAFTLSIDDFVISFFTTGNGVETVSTMVYSMARRGINPVINAVSTIIFAVMLILLLAVNMLSRKERS